MSRYNYYKLYYTYDASTKTYTQIFGIPEDWNTNYANYYVMDFVYVKNTNPVYDASETYYQLSDVVYTYFDADTNQYIKFELLTTEPADWSTEYYNYYTFGHWGVASNYDLCVDSSVLGIDGTAEMIIDFCRRSGLLK